MAIAMKSVTWNELADMYDKCHHHRSRPARTLPMDAVFKWAEGQPERFYVDEDGSLYLIERE